MVGASEGQLKGNWNSREVTEQLIRGHIWGLDRPPHQKLLGILGYSGGWRNIRARPELLLSPWKLEIQQTFGYRNSHGELTEYLLFTGHTTERLTSYTLSFNSQCKGRFYYPGFAKEETDKKVKSYVSYFKLTRSILGIKHAPTPLKSSATCTGIDDFLQVWRPLPLTDSSATLFAPPGLASHLGSCLLSEWSLRQHLVICFFCPGLWTLKDWIWLLELTAWIFQQKHFLTWPTKSGASLYHSDFA